MNVSAFYILKEMGKMAVVAQSKSTWNYVIEYVSATSGLHEVLKAGQYISEVGYEFVSRIPHLLHHQNRCQSAADAFHGYATVASLPEFVSLVADTVQNGATLYRTYISEDPVNEQTLNSLYKNAIQGGIASVCVAADTLDNFHRQNWVNLGKALPFVNGTFYITSLAGDGIDLFEQIADVSTHRTDMASAAISQERKDQIQEKITLGHINIAKDMASIAAVVATIASLFFVVSMSGVSVLPLVGLGCTVLWLSAKITSNFYQKMVIEAHSQIQPLRIA